MKKIIRVLALVLVVALCATALVSCAPNGNPDKAEAALKKNGYTTVHSTVLVKVVGGTDYVSGVNDDGDCVFIVYFEDSKTAKEKFASTKEWLESQAKDNKKDSDWTVAQSGKMIYAGTSAGIKATK